MACSDRIRMIAEKSLERGHNMPATPFRVDFERFAAEKYAKLEIWEKIARAMADAITNQPIYIEEYDGIIGRNYLLTDIPPENCDPSLNFQDAPQRQIHEEIENYDELSQCQLSGLTGLGHITWAWDMVLRLGTSGMKEFYTRQKDNAPDKKAAEFYSGVLIMLDALEKWNLRHVEELERLGMNEQAAICRKVPQYPAETFHEAVQSFFMQYIVVMRENPFGGNGPGRLDYYLWPYLERDLEKGICTKEQAKELIDELFIRIDERIHTLDGFVEAVVVGGTYPNGASAVNPLSNIMIESFMDLNLTHPAVYVRFPEEVPEDFLNLCVRYLKTGGNRAQILSDKAIIKSLLKTGVPYNDAVEYTCGGCMEIGIQGMTSDFLFNGWHNIPKLAELFTTGGHCLVSGKMLSSVKAPGLLKFTSFDEYYDGFIDELSRILNIFFYVQEKHSESSSVLRPSYLVSSMIRDCAARGRNMHDGGARYHDYGSTPLGLPNTADYLFAVKKAVFDDKICDAKTLITAMEKNFEGYEVLRKKLLAIPKYGQDNDEADAFAARLFRDVTNIYTSYRNRFGGTGKAVVMTFAWAPVAGSILGASADGNLAGKTTAHGLTPQFSSMTEGITAAMMSCSKIPFECFNGGASSMWDLSPEWATDDIIKALLTAFIQLGGQIYQGNINNPELLLKAQAHPEEYGSLIVRVGGYSARFTTLARELQDEIIRRLRHSA